VIKEFHPLHWSTVIGITYAALVGSVPGDLSAKLNPSVLFNKLITVKIYG
jgi:hypothetical protein